jgi:hypothetical protein
MRREILFGSHVRTQRRNGLRPCSDVCAASRPQVDLTCTRIEPEIGGHVQTPKLAPATKKEEDEEHATAARVTLRRAQRAPHHTPETAVPARAGLRLSARARGSGSARCAALASHLKWRLPLVKD